MNFIEYTVTNSKGKEMNFGDHEYKAYQFIERILRYPNVKVKITKVTQTS